MKPHGVCRKLEAVGGDHMHLASRIRRGEAGGEGSRGQVCGLL